LTRSPSFSHLNLTFRVQLYFRIHRQIHSQSLACTFIPIDLVCSVLLPAFIPVHKVFAKYFEVCYGRIVQCSLPKAGLLSKNSLLRIMIVLSWFSRHFR
jgi:hypothetical protein